MPAPFFPLRWESTGNQWWYTLPIDFAAANGQYHVVRELLRLDSNQLIKLTSIQRTRRLETVWDASDNEQFRDAAKFRSFVARRLLLCCETPTGSNTLLRAGYGGWLLYTAASAADVDFVSDLLRRDPLLVYGEGEYGVTEILYSAARSKSSEVLRLIVHYATNPRCRIDSGDQVEERFTEPGLEFKRELMYRCTHAAARGGNIDILQELLVCCEDVLIYRDAHGSTLLHSAACHGQVEVLAYLTRTWNVAKVTDNKGNTPLHVAAYWGQLPVVESLISKFPSLISVTNNDGDSFIHSAVYGFTAPGFRLLDSQVKLIKHLFQGKIIGLHEMMNHRNRSGRTALHVAIRENIQADVAELLLKTHCFDLTICDNNGLTPLDLLKRWPKSASSEILIKQLMSAGGVTDCKRKIVRSRIVSYLQGHGIGSKPGTLFTIPDSEILMYAGMGYETDATSEDGSDSYMSSASEASELDAREGSVICSLNLSRIPMKSILHRNKKEEDANRIELTNHDGSFYLRRSTEIPISLRNKHAKTSSSLQIH